MADGFDIHLDKDRAERIAQAAEYAGLTPEAYVLSVVDENLHRWADLAEPSDGGWAEDMERLERYRQTGVSIPLDTAMDEIKAELMARSSAKR